MYKDLLKVVEKEQERRKKAWFRSKKLNAHKNDLLAQANNLMNGMTKEGKQKSNDQTPLTLIKNLNELIAFDDHWEETDNKAKERGWNFFDTMFKLQVELLTRFCKETNHSDQDWQAIKEQVEQIEEILKKRLKNPIRLDKNFLELLKKFDQAQMKVKEGPLTTQKESDAILDLDSDGGTIKAKEDTTPVKGVAVLVDVDHSSIDGHSSNTIACLGNALVPLLRKRAVAKQQEKSNYVSMFAEQDEKTAKESKQHNEFLDGFFKNSTIQKIDLELSPDILMQKLVAVPGFMSYLVDFQIRVNTLLGADKVQTFTMGQLVRPLVYAMKRGGQNYQALASAMEGTSQRYQDDEFHYHCIRNIHAIPFSTTDRTSGIGRVVDRVMALQKKEKSLDPREQKEPYSFALVSSNDRCDNHFVKDVMAVKTLKLSPEQRSVVQTEVHPAAMMKCDHDRNRGINKLGNIILFFIKKRFIEGYYPAEIILADDTREVLQHTTAGVMKSVKDNLNIVELKRHLEESRDSSDRAIASKIDRVVIDQAASAAMNAINVARKNQGLIVATKDGAHFEAILDCLQKPKMVNTRQMVKTEQKDNKSVESENIPELETQSLLSRRS